MAAAREHPPVSEHQLRARIATEHRRRDPDHDLIDDLQRERACIRIEDSVRKILASAPPLTDSQRLRLAAILVGGAADAAA